MQSFDGKVAVVTGGGSGIGRALALRFAREGMRIVLADVEHGALERTRDEVAALGVDVRAQPTDVSSFESVQALERCAVEAFGRVHVLCNNAGVGPQEDIPLWELPLSDWAWTLSVNLWGVIHGVKAFLPGMIAHGEEGHVVNTSSGNGGLTLLPNTPIYATSKSAVSALTEVLHLQLTMHGSAIRASVLYPGPHLVATNIFTASRNRPARFAREVEQALPPFTLDAVRAMVEASGLTLETTSPDEVAEQVIAGLRADAFHILALTDELEGQVRARVENVLQRRNPPLPPMFGG